MLDEDTNTMKRNTEALLECRENQVYHCSMSLECRRKS